MQILIFPITLSSQHSIVRLYIIMFEQHRINLPSPRMKMMMMQADAAMNEEKTETNGQTSYSSSSSLCFGVVEFPEYFRIVVFLFQGWDHDGCEVLGQSQLTTHT